MEFHQGGALLTAIDNVWEFLKDYQAVVPGTEGERGPNRPLTQRGLTPTELSDAPYTSAAPPVMAGGMGLAGGLMGGVLGGPLGAVAGAGLGTAFGGAMGQSIKPQSIRERQAQFRAQQRMLRQKMRQWNELNRRVQSGTARFPEGYEHGPRIQVGNRTYPVRDLLWQPGHERELVMGIPKEFTSGKKRGEQRNIFGPDNRHLDVGKHPVPGRTVFGPGGYVEGFRDWYQSGMSNADRDAGRRAAFLNDRFSRQGWLYPDEMRALQDHHASVNPMLVAGAADKLGLIREKKVKDKKGEAEEESSDDSLEDGLKEESEELKRLAERGKKKTGKISVTEPSESEWHENFETHTAKGHATKDGSTDTYHNMHADTYAKKMKAAWPKGFDLEPPESNKWRLGDWVRKRHFGVSPEAKNLSKYWKTMQKVLPHLDQEGMLKWMRSHPGWEGVPDDFQWLPEKGSKSSEIKSEGVSDSSGRKSKKSLHQIHPLEQAWALLKIG